MNSTKTGSPLEFRCRDCQRTAWHGSIHRRLNCSTAQLCSSTSTGHWSIWPKLPMRFACRRSLGRCSIAFAADRRPPRYRQWAIAGRPGNGMSPSKSLSPDRTVRAAPCRRQSSAAEQPDRPDDAAAVRAAAGADGLSGESPPASRRYGCARRIETRRRFMDVIRQTRLDGAAATGGRAFPPARLGTPARLHDGTRIKVASCVRGRRSHRRTCLRGGKDLGGAGVRSARPGDRRPRLDPFRGADWPTAAPASTSGRSAIVR